MRSSKLQAPSSKKAPNPKLQTKDSIYETASGAWILREEPANSSGNGHPFDLEERTAIFGESVVRFSKEIARGPSSNRLIDQLVGAGTSVGANYCEANECVSKKDFRCSIGRCKKEIKETKFFLRMIVASEPALADEARRLYREATELQRIFAAMYNK